MSHRPSAESEPESVTSATDASFGLERPEGDPFRKGEVFVLRGWRKVAFWFAALGLKLYHRSLRIRVREEETACAAVASPAILVGWHNRSLLYPEVLRRLRNAGNIMVLVSPSKAAAWEAAYFELLGFRVVRATHRRYAYAGSRAMLEALGEGLDVALSPDGPSGPLYTVRAGAARLSRKTRRPLLLLVPNCRTARRADTWDRHLVPLPFSCVEVRLDVLASEDLWGEGSAGSGFDQANDTLQKRLLQLTDDRDGEPFSADSGSEVE